MAAFLKVPLQRQHVPTEGGSLMARLHRCVSQIQRAVEVESCAGSYRSSACAVITIASPSTDATIFMVVHVFKLCGTVMPKYCVTSQKPESLTWENAEPPAQSARINSRSEEHTSELQSLRH